MNILRYIIGAASLVGVALLAYAPATYAATPYGKNTTGTLNVSAQVDGTCQVGTADLVFPTYDPVANGKDKGSANITITCTPGTHYVINLDKGGHSTGLPARFLMGPNASLLPYVLAENQSCSTPWGDDTGGYASQAFTMGGSGTAVHTVFGCIPAHHYVEDGAYSDAVEIGLNFD